MCAYKRSCQRYCEIEKKQTLTVKWKILKTNHLVLKINMNHSDVHQCF